MPRVTKIAVSYSESVSHPLRKIKPQLFSHSQIRPTCFIEAELEEGENYETVRADLYNQCKNVVRDEIKTELEKARQLEERKEQENE